MNMQALSSYNVRDNAKRTDEEAVAELQREVDVRRRIYDRWIAEGRLSRIDAHDRMERILSALKLLLESTSTLVQEPPAPSTMDEHTEKVLSTSFAEN